MDNYSVYRHINKINGKQYIGITKQNPNDRWGQNGRNYKNKCPYFWNAIVKYGWENFEHEVIFTDLSKDEACDMEIRLIRENKTQDKKYGYNILSGGTAPTLPEEVRHKMSKSMIGNKNGLGHPCSDEKRKKIGDALRGRKFSEERKQKLRKPKSVTYACSEEKRQHIIAAKKDKKPVICMETGQTYPSIHECARQMNLAATNICAVLRGRNKSVHGYHFCYFNHS